MGARPALKYAVGEVAAGVPRLQQHRAPDLGGHQLVVGDDHERVLVELEHHPVAPHRLLLAADYDAAGLLVAHRAVGGLLAHRHLDAVADLAGAVPRAPQADDAALDDAAGRAAAQRGTWWRDGATWSVRGRAAVQPAAEARRRRVQSLVTRPEAAVGVRADVVFVGLAEGSTLGSAEHAAGPFEEVRFVDRLEARVRYLAFEPRGLVEHGLRRVVGATGVHQAVAAAAGRGLLGGVLLLTDSQELGGVSLARGFRQQLALRLGHSVPQVHASPPGADLPVPLRYAGGGAVVRGDWVPGLPQLPQPQLARHRAQVALVRRVELGQVYVLQPRRRAGLACCGALAPLHRRVRPAGLPPAHRAAGRVCDRL
ncbi:hydantoinase/oxoprolinase family protein [Babesia caballi]|uniref:Hydantoinase/oxoprolinase family protein n=1 Tax=Babesia caballi TaxID=5871 RepID=A0AAV4LWM5_BABCB|nr:hydantoinase/oxoprolinase family protein [Babesia caballi]